MSPGEVDEDVDDECASAVFPVEATDEPAALDISLEMTKCREKVKIAPNVASLQMVEPRPRYNVCTPTPQQKPVQCRDGVRVTELIQHGGPTGRPCVQLAV